MTNGPGVQVWSDNARQESEQRENKANGRRKFWHAYGEREYDKANGYGI